MTSTPPPPEGELSEEFRKLGENIKQAAHAAWHSDESQKFKQELRSGLHALEAGLKDVTADLTTGETGQRLRAEVQDFSAKVRSGEVESRVRTDLLAALRSVNATLHKSAQAKPTDDKPGDML